MLKLKKPSLPMRVFQYLKSSLTVIWQNLPAPALGFFALALCLIYAIENATDPTDLIFLHLPLVWQTIFTLCLYLPLSLSATIFSFNYRPKNLTLVKKPLCQQIPYWLLQFSMLLLAYTACLPVGTLITPEDQAVFYLLSLGVSAVGIFAIFPFLTKKAPRRCFCRLLIDVIAHGFLTSIIGLILLIGGNLIILAISELILPSSNLGDVHLYYNIFVAFCFIPIYFLSNIASLRPSYYTAKSAPTDNSSGLSFKIITNLAIYLGLPIFFLFNLVLYIYAAKIFLTATWPKGIISILVIADFLIGFLLIFTLKPFLTQIKPKLAKLWRSLPISLIIPLIMMIIAVWMRVAEYSFTPARFYLCLFIIWALASLPFLIFNLHQKTWPTILFALILLLATSCGPLGAYTFSAQMQRGRPDTDFFNTPTINHGDRSEYRFFSHNHSDQTNQPLAIDDYQWYWQEIDLDENLRLENQYTLKWLNRDGNLSLELYDQRAQLVANFDCLPVVLSLLDQYSQNQFELDQSQLTCEQSSPLTSSPSSIPARVKIIFDSLSVMDISTTPTFSGFAQIFLSLPQ